VSGLLLTAAVAAALLRVARSTPTEDVLEEAARAASGGVLPDDFVRLEACDTAEEAPLTFSNGMEEGAEDRARGGGGSVESLDADDTGAEGAAAAVAEAAYVSATAAVIEGRRQQQQWQGAPLPPSHGPGAGVMEDAAPVPGWERPTLAVLSNLLVPLALWIVALSNDDLLHAALLLAFLLTLVWPGNRAVLASTGRVIAGGLALMYLWALDSIPELTGINRPEWEPALRLTGLWQPDLIRAMLPMACILIINCIVLNLPTVVEVLQPLEDEGLTAVPAASEGTGPAEGAREGGGRAGRLGSGYSSGDGEVEVVTWAAFWALLSAAAAEAWLSAVALADGAGAYAVLLTGLSIVEVTHCCLLNLALLGLVGFALIVPLPSDPREERNSPRWRALLGFALGNLAVRYAFGAYPLAKTLGLSEGAQLFLHQTVGLAPNLPPNKLMSQLLGPSVLLIVTHFHRIGALSTASFGVGGGHGGSLFARPRQLSVAANQVGVLPFLRRMAILHSHKLLTLAALYFSLRHIDIFGAVMLAGLVLLTLSLKTAAGPPEILAAVAIAAAVANYAFAIDWLHDELGAHHVNVLAWVGLRRWAPPEAPLWPQHEDMLRATVFVSAALELVRSSQQWLR